MTVYWRNSQKGAWHLFQIFADEIVADAHAPDAAFAEKPPELQILVDKVLEYNLIQVEIALKNNSGPIQIFSDDLGMQKGLAIGRENG